MTVEIPLTRGYTSIIDDEDYAAVSAFKWHAMVLGSVNHRSIYAGRGYRQSEGVGSGRALLHRVIMQAPKGMFVDHINHNGLDNRRCNLRIVTVAQNCHNTRGQMARSGFLGVSRPKNANWYLAHICIDGKRLVVRGFPSPEDAARARDALALRHFGEFAYLNFPRDDVDASSRSGA